MKIWKTLADFFIPKQFANSPVEYRKALILSWMHILLYVILLGTYFVAQAFTNNMLTLMYFSIAFAFVPVSFYIFKKWSNLTLSGNIMSLSWFLFIATQIPFTGGVFSDNVVWMIVCPLIAFFVLGINWGIFWMGIILVTFTSIFFYGKNHPAINVYGHDDNYFFLSYSALCLFVFAFLYIFERSQNKVLQELDNKNILLEEQKKEISAHTEALKLKDEKLQKSNADLQNFAYSASHDLKEPLRMIGMYTQLLQRRIKPTLDERSEEYMFYMTDGVKRMQKLLDDLLLYSRLGKNDNDVQDIDMNQTILMVIYNLTVTIKETNTAIIASNLPTICASSTEMMQLFQNMIANAIKFRRADVAPEIMILHAENEKEHTITLKDNGIGIKEEYKEKVFNIFTKLHSTSQYEGSGIGLATCKKIVEEMGGRMWLTSTEGVGTTFYFTFPKNNMKKKTEQVETIEQEDLVAIN
jgi:signal transduction histidine kinase